MKKPIFDFIDRQIIIDFYKNPPKGNYWNTPIIVTQFEITKAKKVIYKEIEKPFLRINDFIVYWLESFKNRIIN
jgi:hypothetical protein